MIAPPTTNAPNPKWITKMPDRTCENCAAFLHYADGSNRGECRRRAPTLCGEGDAAWPIIARFDWCAEHLEKEES